MHTQEQEDEVRAVIAEFANEEKPFTALDITLAANKIAHYPHRTVRDIVKSSIGGMDELEDYVTSTIEVELEGGATAKAILYHPVYYNPDDYAERSKTLTSTTSNVSAYIGAGHRRSNMKKNVATQLMPSTPVKLGDDMNASDAAQKILNDLGSIGDPIKSDSIDDILNFGK